MVQPRKRNSKKLFFWDTLIQNLKFQFFENLKTSRKIRFLCISGSLVPLYVAEISPSGFFVTRRGKTEQELCILVIGFYCLAFTSTKRCELVYPLFMSLIFISYEELLIIFLSLRIQNIPAGLLVEDEELWCEMILTMQWMVPGSPCRNVRSCQALIFISTFSRQSNLC